MGNNLLYDHRNYLLNNGNIADRLRLASAGNDFSEEQLEELMDEVKRWDIKKIEAYIVLENILGVLKDQIRQERK